MRPGPSTSRTPRTTGVSSNSASRKASSRPSSPRSRSSSSSTEPRRSPGGSSSDRFGNGRRRAASWAPPPCSRRGSACSMTRRSLGIPRAPPATKQSPPISQWTRLPPRSRLPWPTHPRRRQSPRGPQSRLLLTGRSRSSRRLSPAPRRGSPRRRKASRGPRRGSSRRAPTRKPSNSTKRRCASTRNTCHPSKAKLDASSTWNTRGRP